MPYSLNVIRQGYEEVAAAIRVRLTRENGAFYCLVRHDGKTVLRATANRRLKPFDPANLIGTYNRETQTQDIEDDLIERLREITGYAKAA